MPVSEEALRDAIVAIAKVKNVLMDPQALLEDVLALSYALPDEREYRAAIANTCRALEQLTDGKVQSSSLKYAHEGWISYHYQHAGAQGARADMRIMYRLEGEKLKIRGFGHRDMPEDFYVRMAEVR
mgnify:CR=1 FL=1